MKKLMFLPLSIPSFTLRCCSLHPSSSSPPRSCVCHSKPVFNLSRYISCWRTAVLRLPLLSESSPPFWWNTFLHGLCTCLDLITVPVCRSPLNEMHVWWPWMTSSGCWAVRTSTYPAPPTWSHSTLTPVPVSWKSLCRCHFFSHLISLAF